VNDNTKKAEQGNQKLWDEVAPVHFEAYQEVNMLREGKNVLDEIELREVGEVRGKTLLHLQCHIGTDSLSWERQGASVTAIDFSEQSIHYAKRLRDELGLKTNFIHSNVYDLPKVLDQQFDIVYTSRGVLCWLRDIEAWAQVIAHFLKPGGVFYIMESHPICYTLDEEPPSEINFKYPYFHTLEPIIFDDDEPDYADEHYNPKNPSYEWSWSLGEIVNALLKAGLQIELLNEYDRLFYKPFPSMEEHPEAERWYWLPQYADKIPLLFTLKARKVK
jgi:ubiquinone/menaquinone biosynthesis C-methylase UbiE